MAKDDEKSKPKKSHKIPVWDLPDVPTGNLDAHLELQRTRVLCTSDAPTHTENIRYSGAYASLGVDNSLRMEDFRSKFRVEVIELTEDDMEFDMIGVDPAIANAFRRILIAELPTMAIEKVFIANNTSVIQDEVLAHRLGLIPLKVDPRLFDYISENDEPNEKNTIVFKLHARCERMSPEKKENDEPNKKKSPRIQENAEPNKKKSPRIQENDEPNEKNTKLHAQCEKRKSPRIQVKSNELIWLPNGSEFILSTESSTLGSTSKAKTYTSFNCSQDSLPELSNTTIAPTHDDITIAKLGPGQEIELEAHAVKGLGKTHAKWSPVATAWYRMLPEVILLQDIVDEKAEELVKKCPVKVFDIEDIGKGRKRATVARPRACTLCRECIRGDNWDKLVALRRVKDHFIFKIESTGALPPEVLFTEAVKILEDKCERVITELS